MPFDTTEEMFARRDAQIAAQRDLIADLRVAVSAAKDLAAMRGAAIERLQDALEVERDVRRGLQAQLDQAERGDDQ